MSKLTQYLVIINDNPVNGGNGEIVNGIWDTSEDAENWIDLVIDAPENEGKYFRVIPAETWA